MLNVSSSVGYETLSRFLILGTGLSGEGRVQLPHYLSEGVVRGPVWCWQFD
jgi:hypothetical protein